MLDFKFKMASTLRGYESFESHESRESDASLNENQMLQLMNNVYQHGESLLNESLQETIERPLISSKASH
jgi:hypothetical protein